jgi:hypothetical protein
MGAKLSSHLSEKIKELIAQGYSLRGASRVVEIPSSTVHSWYQKGEYGQKGYIQFYEKVEEGRDLYEQKLLDLLNEVALNGLESRKEKKYFDPQGNLTRKVIETTKQPDFRAAQYLLDHRFGYGKENQLAEKSINRFIDLIEQYLDQETFQRIIEEIAHNRNFENLRLTALEKN